MAVLPREFCNFTPDFCGLAPMCIVGRVRRSQQKTVHAEPCEAMPLQPRWALGGKKQESRHIKKASSSVLSLTSKNLANSNDIVRARQQCESLWMWDGQQNGSHVFLLCRIACGRMCPVREHWLMMAQHKSNGCHTD